VFAKKRTQVLHERSARQEPFDDAEVRKLLAAVDEVWIARGRKAHRFPAGEVKPSDLKGPTGRFRAPIVRRGRTLLVGYHADTLAELA